VTRRGIEPVWASIEWLSAHALLAEVRLLVVEGVTDTPTELGAWADFVRSVDPGVPVRVMAFRHTGTRKAAREWLETSPERLDHVIDQLTSLGLTSVTA
jgi:pyruvate-formate lyase-activating enzyme